MGELQTAGMQMRLAADFDTAKARVIEALKTEGFGILTEIDVRQTLKAKLNVDFRRYTILGACNPPLAHRMLTTTPEAGLLLPCNVTVTEENDGTTLVSAVDPQRMLGVFEHPELKPIACEARERLSRALASLKVAA